MPEISAVIITYNEENLIGKCLSSLEGIADEIIVVDSFSTDRTEEICRDFNVRFIKRAFGGYMDQKNYALKLATYKKIISLDADEALSDALRKSVLAVKKNWNYDGYFFRRRNFFNGKWIKHAGWYPDKQLRLFISDSGKFGKLNFHEKFILENGSRVKTLDGDLLHWTTSSYEEFFEKVNRYAQLGAQEYFKAGIKSNILTPFIHSIWGFIRSYIIELGFLDGKEGFCICSRYSGSVFSKYSILRKLNKAGLAVRQSPEKIERDLELGGIVDH